MRIDELIEKLKAARKEFGNTEVYAHDGLDPSDLRPVARIAPGVGWTEIYAE